MRLPKELALRVRQYARERDLSLRAAMTGLLESWSRNVSSQGPGGRE